MDVKVLTLSGAFELLEKSVAIIVDDDILMYPSLSSLTGNPDNEFLYLSWDYEGLTYSIKVKEENNEIIAYKDSSLYFEDDEGNDVKITLLTRIDDNNEVD